jgi:hypothetical protein
VVAVSATIPASGNLVISNFGALPFVIICFVTEAAGNKMQDVASAPFKITGSAIFYCLMPKLSKANCTDLGVITAQVTNGTSHIHIKLQLAPAPLASDTNWVTGNTFTRSGSLGTEPAIMFM